jgi:hypothetical protein
METIIFYKVEPDCIYQKYRIREHAETCCGKTGNKCESGYSRCLGFIKNPNRGKLIKEENEKNWWTI